MCQWMISRGAQKLVLTSRTGVKTGYQHAKLHTFQELGACTKVLTLDVSDFDEASELLNEASRMGKIGGIFHLVGVSRREYN